MCGLIGKLTQFRHWNSLVLVPNFFIADFSRLAPAIVALAALILSWLLALAVEKLNKPWH